MAHLEPKWFCWKGCVSPSKTWIETPSFYFTKQLPTTGVGYEHQRELGQLLRSFLSCWSSIISYLLSFQERVLWLGRRTYCREGWESSHPDVRSLHRDMGWQPRARSHEENSGGPDYRLHFPDSHAVGTKPAPSECPVRSTALVGAQSLFGNQNATPSMKGSISVWSIVTNPHSFSCSPLTVAYKVYFISPGLARHTAICSPSHLECPSIQAG